MKLTTKARVLVYLRSRQPSYISGTELENMSRDWGTKASTISRRARDLEDEGRIERKIVAGCVWYRLTQAEPIKPVKPDNVRLFDMPIKKVMF